MTTGYLALGANLGDPRRTFRWALRSLRRAGVAVERVSGLYRSRPAGGPAQPDYLNAAARVRSGLAPGAALAAIRRIERRCGRVRTGQRNAPRPLDLDLLFWGDAVRRTARLTLPHPRWRSRDFVVVPLREVMPAAERRRRRVPVSGRTGRVSARVAGPAWAGGGRRKG